MSDAVLVAAITSAAALLTGAAKGLWSVMRYLADQERRRAEEYKAETQKTLDSKNTEINALKTEVLELRQQMTPARGRTTK